MRSSLAAAVALVLCGVGARHRTAVALLVRVVVTCACTHLLRVLRRALTFVVAAELGLLRVAHGRSLQRRCRVAAVIPGYATRMSTRKVVVVTGGSAGVGRAVVREFAGHGYD